MYMWICVYTYVHTICIYTYIIILNNGQIKMVKKIGLFSSCAKFSDVIF